MAKKTVEKKPKRRLKRTVRRSMAAVLMITAVVVAAIPVPENVAAPDGVAMLAEEAGDVHIEGGYLDGTNPAGSVPYKYDIKKSDDIALPRDVDLSKHQDDSVTDLIKSSDIQVAYGITNLGGGEYSLGWQFMYYEVTSPRSGGTAGAVCRYNTFFYTPTIDLSLYPTTKYFTVETADYDKYYTDDWAAVDGMDGIDPRTPVTYTLDSYLNNHSPLDYQADFFTKYFKDDYDTRMAAFAAYKTRYDAYQANPDRAPDPGPRPEDFTRTPSVDLKATQRLQYFCDHNNRLKDIGTDFTLFPVRDARPGEENGGQGQVYLAKDGKLPEASRYHNDDNGFLILESATYSMCAIANKAFQDVTNVETMNIPSQIAYIGDEAFSGASMLNSITLNNVDVVGNRAFQGCTNLRTVDLGQTTKQIGAECFRGTIIESVKFSNQIAKIGYGAFSNCDRLTTVTFQDGGAECTIGDYAFYNCTALRDVSMTKTNIAKIGDGNFAVEGGAQATHFILPEHISAADGLGNYLFAGRSNLEYVVFPTNYGRSRGSGTNGASAVIPPAMFHGCINLQHVTFPADWKNDPTACGFVSYDPKVLFADVINRDFYVEGPELHGNGQHALPRRSTWDAVTAVSGVVPYLYHKDNKDYWEVSDGFYLLGIENTGILKSCTLKPGADVTKWNGILDIPAMVGKTPVKGIGDTCFTDSELNEKVLYLRIPDNSIESIAGGVFKGGTGKNGLDWLQLKAVYIGDSVKSIGAEAFAGCKALNDIFLNSPKAAHKDFILGDNAFKTESNGLTIHGDIDVDYAPFKWAMGDHYVRADGVRACYKSLVPSYLTVIRDDNTKLATLVDYPKLQDVSKILDEAYKFDIMAGPDGSFTNPYKNYIDMRINQSYAQWYGEDGDTRREAFKAAWINATSNEEREAVYGSDNYGPWVNPEFVADSLTWETAVTPPSGGDDGGDETPDTGGSDSGDTAMNQIADFLFEPIVAYAAERVRPYYESADGGIRYEIGVSDPTNEELNLLRCVRNIAVPAGVASIDVYSYFYGVKGADGKRTGQENNQKSAGIYFGSSKQGNSWYMYTTSLKQEKEDPTDVVPGLFSGYYDDGIASNAGEKFKRGNDQILSVTMNSVQYLPDYAFDSCENLTTVNLGPACSDIGVAPFRGCYEMETVGDNDYYTTTNGIIYSKNTDGSLTIEECLSARGRKSRVGPALINSETDENIKNVSAIKPGAFEDCDDITRVLFGNNDTAGLTEIPEDCFRNCDLLNEVELPVTVNDIGRGAFVGAKNLSNLTIHGDEVKISGSAFNSDKGPTVVRAHEDSAVVRYVKEYGDEYHLEMDERNPLGKSWKVSFYDANYNLIEDLRDKGGNPIDNPQYITNGGSVKTFPVAPEMEGWTFEEWIGLNGADPDYIEKDSIFYAKGHFDGGLPVNGTWWVEVTDGIDGRLIGDFLITDRDGKYRVPVDESFADQGWNVEHPPHAGYEPNGFVYRYESGKIGGAWTINTKVDGNMSVIALYREARTSGTSTNTPGGTTNPSGGTTNTSNNSSNNGGNTTSNNSSNSSSSSSSSSSSTSSSSTSSSSTSSSSTSTTSTTSGAGVYTVFVENGSGSGTYAPGTTVIIQAAIPAAGMRFSNWTTDSNGVTLASASMAATTFTMPSNNVTVKANYVADTAATPAAAGTNGGTAARDTDGNTRVDIEKPGISNRDLATANVNGSTDNFIVKISETDEATRAVAAALTNKYGSLDNILYYAMDISLYDSTGTTKISDTTGLSVDITIPIPDSLVAYGGNNKAGSVVSGDQLESLNENFTTINGVPCIRFRATHFSPYTIYVDTGNLVEGMLDTTPKTGDPIHPKWFLSLGLACLSIILFMKKDRKVAVKAAK